MSADNRRMSVDNGRMSVDNGRMSADNCLMYMALRALSSPIGNAEKEEALEAATEPKDRDCGDG
jgi:hypothetical protein